MNPSSTQICRSQSLKRLKKKKNFQISLLNYISENDRFRNQFPDLQIVKTAQNSVNISVDLFMKIPPMLKQQLFLFS